MAVQQQHMNLWRKAICTWYKDYATKTYFVPAVTITRTPCDVVNCDGKKIHIIQHLTGSDTFNITSRESKIHSAATSTTLSTDPTPTNLQQGKLAAHKHEDSQIWEDLSVQPVLECIRELAEKHKEVMFVISNLQFGSYLGNSDDKTLVQYFLTPKSLPSEFRQGDFDILVLHRHYGILTGEVKSIGCKRRFQGASPNDEDESIAIRVKTAIKQLNKSEFVLRELTNDLDPYLAISKTLILPFIARSELLQILEHDQHLEKDLVNCLQVSNAHQAVEWCLLADNLSMDDPENNAFHSWCTRRVAHLKHTNMPDHLYLNLLARFCGPATTVFVPLLTALSPRFEVRTEGQGVSLVGERMTSLILTPEQYSLLTRAPPRALLTGPPGVGKSVMLQLIARKWLAQGRDVHLFSLKRRTLAATHALLHAIQTALPANSHSSVAVHEYDFYDNEIDEAIAKVHDVTQGWTLELGVICDEFWAHESNIAAVRYNQFVTELCTRFPNLCLWAASPYNHQRPPQLPEEKMTIPLRCPPVVLREVIEGLGKYKNVDEYTTTSIPSPCDGTSVITVSHQGFRHRELWPVECDECGREVAAILRRLNVGPSEAGSKPGNTKIVANKGKKRKTSTPPPPLQYRDVFVLTGSKSLQDDVEDDAGRVTSRASGVVRGLRECGIPVRVVKEGPESRLDVLDTAVAGSDMVTAAYYGTVCGLERKVVVWLPHKNQGEDDNKSDEQMKARAKFCAKSRCTAQLVEVVVPLPKEQPTSEVQTK